MKEVAKIFEMHCF